MKKIQISAIVLVILVSIIASCFAVNADTEIPIDIRGYVYYDLNITQPDQVIANVGNENFPAILPYEYEQVVDNYGYYVFQNFTTNNGDVINFDVVLSGYFYQNVGTLTVTDNPSYKNINLTIDSSTNHAPYQPYDPIPSNDETDQKRTITLSWAGGDPDGDEVSYDVYFGNETIFSKVISNQSNTSYDPGILDYDTDYYWQIIAWDELGLSSEGLVWTFKTKSASSPPGDDDDSSPPGGRGGGTVIQNQPPTAVATVDVNTGNPGLICTFDASESNDPDGEIVEYRWDFGDGTTETSDQTTITHTFTSIGTYNVLLTVEDNEGATDSLDDPIIIEILVGNNPPKDLIVTPEKTWTHKNADVLFEMSATDPDENDTLRFEIDWDDETTFISDHIYESNETFMISHLWDSFGVYQVTVTAFDEANASSDTVTTTMYVDVIVIDDVINGWLIDTNSDGTFDVFRNTDIGQDMNVSRHDESMYLIDANDDGNWDYTYDVDTETLEAYAEEEPEDDEDGSLIAIFVLVGLILLLFIIFAYIAYKNKKDQQKREQQKKKSEEGKKSTSSSKGKKKSSSKKK
jgi:PKD repeat protein